MPPGVSGVLLKIMLSCDIFLSVVYICLCVFLPPVFWRIKVFISNEHLGLFCSFVLHVLAC